ncbi:DUF5134 domain-containing protein [Streptomyces sp. ADI93-02]|uniref:DUF5134 domain-containing protein n=1 Tax=Streptomyces sp. ADI93-02 TaxID=1522757 RepID=UPI000F54FBFB|nr:DUF5134 domain-containing protein [Streptomyces sp. ADI93-02]RPK32124.1 hypothetical protein EES40_36720 [Streptomyces sp. ADI93-02]
MSPPDAVYCMLSVLFGTAAVHALTQGLSHREPGWRSRAGHLLHAAMALAMAAMPWSWGRALPVVPQTAFFAAAALWFCFTAAGRRDEPRWTATARNLPAAVGMAAMAWMTHFMASAVHGGDTTVHAGHLGSRTGGSQAADTITAALALYLLICSLWSLARCMPTFGKAPDTAGRPRTNHAYGHFWDGSMALGTAVMLLMPH